MSLLVIFFKAEFEKNDRLKLGHMRSNEYTKIDID